MTKGLCVRHTQAVISRNRQAGSLSHSGQRELKFPRVVLPNVFLQVRG